MTRQRAFFQEQRNVALLLKEGALTGHWKGETPRVARSANERVFDILDSIPETINPRRRHSLPPRVRGEVVYENVSFRYGPDRIVLRNISLQARAGPRVPPARAFWNQKERCTKP